MVSAVEKQLISFFLAPAKAIFKAGLERPLMLLRTSPVKPSGKLADEGMLRGL